MALAGLKSRYQLSCIPWIMEESISTLFLVETTLIHSLHCRPLSSSETAALHVSRLFFQRQFLLQLFFPILADYCDSVGPQELFKMICVFCGQLISNLISLLPCVPTYSWCIQIRYGHLLHLWSNSGYHRSRTTIKRNFERHNYFLMQLLKCIY